MNSTNTGGGGGYSGGTSGESAATGMAKYAQCQKDSGVSAFVTASPVNLSEIATFSKFRSCVGHDYSDGANDGTPITGAEKYEKFSSMKHYVTPKVQSAGAHASAYAPFDGVVVSMPADQKITYDPGVQIQIVSLANPAYTFIFMHVYGASVKVGDHVKAGDLIAYHEVQAASVGYSSFDLAMQLFDPAASLIPAALHVSFLEHLTPTVATAYSTAGVTFASSSWTRAQREANPCSMRAGGYFTTATSPSDLVSVKG